VSYSAALIGESTRCRRRAGGHSRIVANRKLLRSRFLATSPANFLEARHERLVAVQPRMQGSAKISH
jgi:hypothetical protein